MTVSIIVAHTLIDRVIGNDNRLLWHIPEDLKFFREATEGKVVIMGRKTYESIPEKNRPLPNRTTYILTRNENYKIDHSDVRVYTNVEHCLMMAKLACSEVMIAGGEEIYKLLLPYTDRIYATILNEKHEGDAHFPPLDPDVWGKMAENLIGSENLELFYNRVIFERRKGASPEHFID